MKYIKIDGGEITNDPELIREYYHHLWSQGETYEAFEQYVRDRYGYGDFLEEFLNNGGDLTSQFDKLMKEFVEDSVDAYGSDSPDEVDN